MSDIPTSTPGTTPESLQGLPDGEDIARLRQAEASADNPDVQDLPPDPTGATPDQMAAKQASVALGDQDAVNLEQAYRYPAGAELPTATNVRRFPELFTQEVIDSFNVDDQMTDEQRDEHNQAVSDHWASRGVELNADTDTTTTGSFSEPDNGGSSTRVTGTF